RDPGRWLLEEDALVRGLPDLADPLARVADPDLPLLGTGLALAAFLTAGVASQTLDALTAESAWAGTLKQGSRSYPTQLTLSSRQGNRFTGDLKLDFGHGRGHFSFEGVLLAGRLVFLVTDKVSGPVTYPGLYTAELRSQKGFLEGTWRVPSYG